LTDAANKTHGRLQINRADAVDMSVMRDVPGGCAAWNAALTSFAACPGALRRNKQLHQLWLAVRSLRLLPSSQTGERGIGN